MGCILSYVVDDERGMYEQIPPEPPSQDPGEVPSQGSPGAQSQGSPGAQSQGSPGAQSQGSPGAQSQGSPGAQSQGSPGAQSQGSPEAQSQGSPEAPRAVSEAESEINALELLRIAFYLRRRFMCIEETVGIIATCLSLLFCQFFCNNFQKYIGYFLESQLVFYVIMNVITAVGQTTIRRDIKSEICRLQNETPQDEVCPSCSDCCDTSRSCCCCC